MATGKKEVKKPATAKQSQASTKTLKTKTLGKATLPKTGTGKTQKPKKEADILIAVDQQVQDEQANRELKAVEPFSILTSKDIEKFQSGKHYKLFEKLGSREIEYEGVKGVYFAVWAPDAAYVSVIGDFNKWDRYSHTLYPRWDRSGIWEGFIPHLQKGELYKYFIRGNSGAELEKGDPYANYWEVRPKTASIIWNLNYQWKDSKWMASRKKKNSLHSPISVYELHLGSWRRPDPNNEELFYSYQEITERLVPYVKEMGFTHIELMPIMEHPFDGSWGYQQTGYYAPTSRYGTPQEFMAMVDAFHQAGIGVILDWVPSHFPYDAHGLFRFDGSNVYEYADMRKGFQPDWNSYIFNYSRNEVRAFLISNALFWLEKFHIDGLRVDAVASMIYLDYSRKEGEWVPNEYGGHENLEAISFLKELNEVIYDKFPDTQTIAEESTAYYGVSKPTFMGGLGFGMKWMMGWMSDTLSYFRKDPFYRQWHQNQISFSTVYAFSENFMLPLSHDEVVHGKASLIYKMPGDDWQKFANLRLLYTYMFTHPGTKLLFMGNEFAQTQEWNYKTQLSWELLQYESHRGVQQLVKDLNHLYTTEPALFEKQFEASGFEWIDLSDYQSSIIIYARKGKKEEDSLIIALNMTPVVRENYKIGTLKGGKWQEILNSDHKKYWGSGVINEGIFAAKKEKWQNREHHITITLPPLGGVILKKM